MIVSDLIWRFGQSGWESTREAIVTLQYEQYKLVESVATLRTTYLYLAFGLLAAGSMLSRVGKRLTGFTEENINAYKKLEWDTQRVTLLMGLQAGQAKIVMADLQELGRITEYTSAESAETARVFAMSGKRFTEVGEAIAAIQPVLALATIGQMEHTEAARYSIDAMNQFGYAMENLGGIVDVFTNAARLSNVEVSELAVSMSYAGTVANQYNATLADTVTFMGLAADAGIRGGRSGRYFREGIDSLAKSLAVANPELLTHQQFIDRVRAAEQELQKTMFTNEGQFTSLENAIEILDKALGDLEPAERNVILRAELGARNWAAWAAVMDRLEEGTDEYRRTVHELSLALASAQAEWILQTKYGGDAKKQLMDLRIQFEACGGSVAELGKSFEDLTPEEQAHITRVIEMADSQADLAEALNSTANATAIAQEQLKTLNGSLVLLESSIETMHETLGASLRWPLMVWYNSLRHIADYISKMPEALQALIAVVVFSGGALATYSGQIMMIAGGISMLIAALVILTQQRYRDMAALVSESMATSRLTQEEAIEYVMERKLTETKGMLYVSTKLLATEMRHLGLSMTAYVIPALKMTMLTMGSMFLGMWLVTKGAEDGSRGMQHLGMAMMFLLPMLEMYLVLLKGINLATIKNIITNIFHEITLYRMAVAALSASSAFIILSFSMLTVTAIVIGMYLLIRAVVYLFKNWDKVIGDITKTFEKLGKIFRYVFFMRHSPSFLETLQSSAILARENINAFNAWKSSLASFPSKMKKTEFGALATAPAGGKNITVNIMSGSRISLSRDTLPQFDNLLRRVKNEVLEEVSNLI